MGELVTNFDYRTLNADTRNFVQERAAKIHHLARATAMGIMQIGEHLTEVKARLKHGDWLPWLKEEFGWKHDTATRFMNVYERFKLRNLSNLQIDVSALYLIAAPKTPDPVRAEIIRHAEVNPDKVTHSAVRDIVVEYNKSGDAPRAVAKIFDAVRAAKEQARILPSPAEARRIAINTGKHTLDRTGTYRPPMTAEAQAAWRADMLRLEPLREFLRWIEQESGIDEVVRILRLREWTKTFPPAGPAILWLQTFERIRCEEEPKRKMLKS